MCLCGLCCDVVVGVFFSHSSAEINMIVILLYIDNCFSFSIFFVLDEGNFTLYL